MRSKEEGLADWRINDRRSRDREIGNWAIGDQQPKAFGDKRIDNQTIRHGRKRRELNSSSSLLRTSYSLPTFSLRVLVDRAVLLLLPAKEKIPDDPDGHPVNGEQDSLSTAT